MLRLTLTAALVVLGSLISSASGVFAQPPVSEFRSIDGTGNNITDPSWGSAGTPLLRIMPNAYEDGISQPPTTGLPNPRVISNEVFAQGSSMVNGDNLSSMFWQWGQFIDHDISRTPLQQPYEPFDVPVPAGDPFFDPLSTGFQYIFLQRAKHTFGGVREQVNTVSSFIDGSGVYGSDSSRTAELRALDGTGRMKTSAGDLMPHNVNQFDNDPDRLTAAYYLAGDQRANEVPGLTALHTLFVREHNYRADSLRAANPGWTGDEVFEMARAIVGAELQIITYQEFLPLLLGAGALSSYTGYDPTANPAIANVFSTAAYRFGHSMLPVELMRLDENFQPIVEGHVQLRDAYFSTSLITDGNDLDPLFRGLIGQASQLLDTFITDEVRNFLFGAPGLGGFDLVALNIQRGRDHGLRRYNDARRDLGLAAKNSFAEVSSDPDVQAALAVSYASVEDIDVSVGGLAEDPAPGALVGELYVHIIRDQFERLRDGDRFWYSGYLPVPLVAELEAQTLSAIIRRNTGVGAEIPENAFLIPTTLAVGDRFAPTASGLNLSQAFPNPAVGPVTLGFTIPAASSDPIRITVHDAQGREVRAILDGWVAPGQHRVRWNGRDARGQTVSPGVFFFRVKLGEQVAGRRFIVIGQR